MVPLGSKPAGRPPRRGKPSRWRRRSSAPRLRPTRRGGGARLRARPRGHRGLGVRSRPFHPGTHPRRRRRRRPRTLPPSLSVATFCGVEKLVGPYPPTEPARDGIRSVIRFRGRESLPFAAATPWRAKRLGKEVRGASGGVGVKVGVDGFIACISDCIDGGVKVGVGVARGVRTPFPNPASLPCPWTFPVDPADSRR